MRLLRSGGSSRAVLAAAVCTIVAVGGDVGTASAGEAKGPPGTPGVIGSGSESPTGAPAHANSICAFSGLNDFRAENGQIVVIVQSPGQEHRLGNTPPGVPGEACKGGSNPHNPPA
ncbi:MAG TPA: hypothetical protein VGO14_02160 [Solirubrobacteraceae bacterium]|jgi:hypothetical protein|nr:hypothetical protein [Solirubrobacteraceae bacterium]